MSKILIVEDEESIADLEKDYLELSGFEVEVANDGQTGLDKALFGDFEVLIRKFHLTADEERIYLKYHRDSFSASVVKYGRLKERTAGEQLEGMPIL